MTHDFIVNDENIVNEYGYRVMTNGIELKQYKRNPIVLFIHDRGFGKPSGADGREVIGRAVKLWKKDGQLIATIEFDVEDKYAKRIAGKVERGYIKMASIYADVKETSMEPDDVLPGQIFETVTKSKLVEISIVDIGGNDNALKLSMDGKRIKLKRINHKNQNEMDKKVIALALGESSDLSDEKLAEKIREIKLAKDTAETRVQELEGEIKTSRTTEATALVDEAIELGLLPKGLKESQLKAFENDFDGQKAVLSKLVKDAKEENGEEATHSKVKEVVLGAKGSGKKTDTKQTYDYLQKHDPIELARIHKEEPEKYVKLAKEYEAGVRHKE